MKGDYLGELEELILLVTGILFDDAYGVSIRDELYRQTGRDINISAVHAVLKRLQDKGYLDSRMDGATSERGGRRKRLFTITALGKKVLSDSVHQRSAMFKSIPDLVWKTV